MREEHRRKVTSITRSHTHSGAHYGASRTDRSAFGYWIPLALTVTAATVGLVAWVWSERSDEDSESEPEHYYSSTSRPGSQRPGPQYGGRQDGPGPSGPPPGSFGGDAAAAAGAAGLGAAAGYSSMGGGPPPGPGPLGPGPPPGGYVPGPPTHGGFQGPPPGGEAASFYRDGQSRNISTSASRQEEQGFLGRMSSALGMTRGDTPGRTNFSGGGWASGALAAAGSMVEGAMNSVRGSLENVEEHHDRNISMTATGEQKTHFSDQEKWSEEADKPERKDSISPRKSQQSIGSAAAAGLGAAALGSVALSGSRADSTRDSAAQPGSTRGSFVEGRGSAVDVGSARASFAEGRGSAVDMGPARASFAEGRGSTVDMGSTRGSAVDVGSARASFAEGHGSAVDMGSARGSVVDRESIRGSKRSLSGTAAEFYSGAVEAPHHSSLSTIYRKTVAVVVSSLEKGDGTTEVDMHQSILAHLPEHLNTDRTRVVVLIYAPDLHIHPLSAVSRRASERRSQSAPSARSRSTSSYHNINTPGADGTPLPTPGDFPQDAENSASDDQGILAHVSPRPTDSQGSLSQRGSRRGSRASAGGDRRPSELVQYVSGDDEVLANPVDEETSSLFKTLYNQANAIVDRDTSIIPFTRPESCKHILRSIQPELVYIQESLCGTDGSVVSELQGWVKNVVVVIGDEGGLGGLVDSDDEDGVEKYRVDSQDGETWWKRESVTGLGRGVSVVEGLRVGEDWNRRVNEEE